MSNETLSTTATVVRPIPTLKLKRGWTVSWDNHNNSSITSSCSGCETSTKKRKTTPPPTTSTTRRSVGTPSVTTTTTQRSVGTQTPTPTAVGRKAPTGGSLGHPRLELNDQDELDYLEFKNELIDLTIQLVQWKGPTTTSETTTTVPTFTTMTSTSPAQPTNKRKTIA